MPSRRAQRRQREPNRPRAVAEVRPKRGHIRPGVRFYGALLLAMLGGGGFWLAKQREPTTVSAHLAGASSVSMRFDASAYPGVSPMCGCELPGAVGGWRGITFPTRGLTIRRTSATRKWTAFTISAPDADTTSFIPSGFYLSGKAAALGRGPVVPRLLERRAERSVEAPTFIISSRSELHVALLGSTPLASWMPAHGSMVTIRTVPSEFGDQPPARELTEAYGPQVLAPGQPFALPDNDPNAFPVADVLGPRVVIWTRDARAVLAHGNQGVLAPKSSRAWHGVALVLPDPTFAVRVAAIPMTTDEFRSWLGDWRGSPPTQEQTGPSDEAQEYGQVSVRLQGDPVTAEEYGAIRNEVRAEPRVSRKYRPYPPGIPAENWEVFRRPPLPARGGFNVFGRIDFLDVADVTGALVIRDEPVSLDAPSNVKLRDLTGFRPVGDEVSIPIPLRVGAHSATLRFAGVSHISVNGVDRSPRVAAWREIIEPLGLILAVLSGIVALIAVPAALRTWSGRLPSPNPPGTNDDSW